MNNKTTIDNNLRVYHVVTSTGKQWFCNTEVLSPKYEGYQYTGFALTEDKKPFAILWDAEENEILQPL